MRGCGDLDVVFGLVFYLWCGCLCLLLCYGFD